MRSIPLLLAVTLGCSADAALEAGPAQLDASSTPLSDVLVPPSPDVAVPRDDVQVPRNDVSVPAPSSSCDAGAKDATVGTIAVNTWVEIPSEYVVPTGGGEHFPQGWNKVVYDCVGQRILDVDRWYDTVHGDTIYANAVIGFDPASGQGELIKISNWQRQATASGGYTTVAMPENAADPTPVDRHPYGAVAFVPTQNALYLCNGANQTAPNGHASAENTWRLDLATRAWTVVPSTEKPPNNLEECMAYDAGESKLVYVGHSSSGETTVYTMDPGVGQWSIAPATPGPPQHFGCSLAYDPVRRRSLLFGGYHTYPDPSTDLWAYDAAANRWTQLADAPLAAHAPGWAYDPNADIVLAGAQGPSRTLVYAPATDTWSEITPPSGASWPSIDTQAMAYDPADDVFVYQGGNWQGVRWFIFRYRP